MKTPTYIGIEGARQVLADMGIHLTTRQIKRAADPDANGRRKLPFFVDPIDKRLKIDKHALVEIYNHCQVNAMNNARVSAHTLKNELDRVR